MFKEILHNVKQNMDFKLDTIKTVVITAVLGVIANSRVVSAETDVNDKLGFGKSIDPVKYINKAGTVTINIASGMAVAAGVVLLIQGIQAFFQARDSHDTTQMMTGFGKLFIGIGCAASGGIALYFVNLA